MFPAWLLNRIADTAQSGDWGRLMAALGLSIAIVGFVPVVLALCQRAPELATSLLSAGFALAFLAMFISWCVTVLFEGVSVAGASSAIHTVFTLSAIGFVLALIWNRPVAISLCAIPMVAISSWSILSAPALLIGAQRVADGAGYRIFISDGRGGYASSFHLWDLRGASLNGIYGSGYVVSHHAVLEVDEGAALFYWSKAALNWHLARNNRVFGSAAFERARAAP